MLLADAIASKDVIMMNEVLRLHKISTVRLNGRAALLLLEENADRIRAAEAQIECKETNVMESNSIEPNSIEPKESNSIEPINNNSVQDNFTEDSRPFRSDDLCENSLLAEAEERLAFALTTSFKTDVGSILLENDLLLWIDTDAENDEKWLETMAENWSQKLHTNVVEDFCNALALWVSVRRSNM